LYLGYCLVLVSWNLELFFPAANQIPFRSLIYAASRILGKNHESTDPAVYLLYRFDYSTVGGDHGILLSARQPVKHLFTAGGILGQKYIALFFVRRSLFQRFV
jgi:hypothetical protein